MNNLTASYFLVFSLNVEDFFLKSQGGRYKRSSAYTDRPHSAKAEILGRERSFVPYCEDCLIPENVEPLLVKCPSLRIWVWVLAWLWWRNFRT